MSESNVCRYGTLDFELSPYIELGGDYSNVTLWKVVFGAMQNLDNDPADNICVLALTAEHAIAIANAYTRTIGCDEEIPSGWARPILSVEAISASILVDYRFVNASGYVECPPKEAT